eukprot:jgi/Botrbrau1/14721/Bobra.0108s0070.1
MLQDQSRADVERQLAVVNAQIEQLLYKLGQEGLLDDQFAQLMQLQDEQNPNFVAEVVELYFVDSEQKLIKLEAKLAEPVVDFNDVDQLVHQFKGSSASFGAQTIAAICYSLREGCQAGSKETCQEWLAKIKDTFSQLKGSLSQFIELENKRKALEAFL